MAPPRKLSIPTSILADARFAAAPFIDGTDARHSGSGLTGADIGLFLIVLDRAADADENDNVRVPQLDFTQMAGKVDPIRITAALARLEGTNLMHGPSLMWCVKSFGQLYKGTTRSAWSIQLDRKVIAAARKARDAGAMTSIDPEDMKPLSSRLSMALWCRFVSIIDGAHPPLGIGFGKDNYTAAMELTVPKEFVPALFGHNDKVNRAELKRLVLTTSARSPIRREMMMAGVSCDIDAIVRAGFKDDFGVKVQMTTMTNGRGLRYLSAKQRHQDDKKAARKARYARMSEHVAKVSAERADADR